jgi:BNR/Asp-box repeat
VVLDRGATLLGIDNRPNNAGPQLVRSTDNGQTWEVVHRFSGSFRRLVSDPTAPGAAYVCAQEGGGLIVSTDSGATWHRRNAGGGDCFVVAVEPRTRVVVASFGGRPLEVWRSADHGVHWQRHRLPPVRVPPGYNHPEPDAFSSIVFDPQRHGTVVAIDFSGNVFRSTDDGRNWSNAWAATDVTFKQAGLPRWFHSGTPEWIAANDGRLVAGPYQDQSRLNSTPNVIHFLTSTDHGRSWHVNVTCALPHQACNSAVLNGVAGPPAGVGANLLSIGGPSPFGAGGTNLLRLPRGVSHWQLARSRIT